MNISGATSSAYMTSLLKLSDDKAVYRCVVTNALSKVISYDATLTVLGETMDNVSEFALVAKEQLDKRDQVTLDGFKIQSNSHLIIGNDGHVAANVLSIGNITIGDRTEVKGSIYTGGGICFGSGTKIISGTVSVGQIVPTVDIENHPVAYGTTDVTVNNNETRTLTPGNYQDLHAYSYSILKLMPGTYNFRKFYLEANVALIFNLNRIEKAEVNIDNETRFGDYCAMSIDGTARMFSIKWYSNYSAQEISINPDSRIAGQLIMSNSNVHVYSRSIINGLCHSKSIIFDPQPF